MSEQAMVHSLLSDLREALVFQRELGLQALEIDDKVLRPRKARSSASPAEAEVGSLGGSHGSAPEQAREELARMLKGGAKLPGQNDSAVASSGQSGDSKLSPLHQAQSNLVLGAGNPNARLMFVGEAPRRDVELLGEPFVGPAGDLLTKMIQAMGLERSDVYLTNVVKRRRARQNQAEPASPDACKVVLSQQIDVIRPEVIVTFGEFATELLLGDNTPISKMRGQWCESEGVAVMPTFHPNELLRDAAKKKPVWMDLQVVMHRLGLKRPGS
jgi:uracil-DNA glycosylase